MLKHSRIYPRKKGWTMRYLRWLQEQQFDRSAHQIALQEMVEAVRLSKEGVERLEKVIEEVYPHLVSRTRLSSSADFMMGRFDRCRHPCNRGR
jgi:hypothetical protein